MIYFTIGGIFDSMSLNNKFHNMIIAMKKIQIESGGASVWEYDFRLSGQGSFSYAGNIYIKNNHLEETTHAKSRARVFQPGEQ